MVITDGEVELVEQPQVTLTLTNESTGGQTVLTHLNKYRADSGGLYLFNYDFSTVSTHTSTPGWMVRMELTDPDDTLSVSGRLELEVTELLRTDTSVVIGENEYILTAADAGGLEYVFQSFQVATGSPSTPTAPPPPSRTPVGQRRGRCDGPGRTDH